MFDLLNTMIVCFTLLAAITLVLIALPNSPFRSAFLQVIGWFFCLLMLALIASPIDFISFIPLDDILIYLPAGVGAALMALRQRKTGGDTTPPKKRGRPRKEQPAKTDEDDQEAA